MAGGDLRVVNSPGFVMGGVSATTVIDANSVASGNMTEARRVGDQTVYMTSEGAAAFDGLRGNGFDNSVQEDPGWLSRFFMGDSLAGKEQAYLGDPG